MTKDKNKEIKIATPPKPILQGGTLIFSQESDTCSDQAYQTLEVEVLDGGAGKYFRLKTDSWAFDAPQELMEILDKVRTAFEIPSESLD